MPHAATARAPHRRCPGAASLARCAETAGATWAGREAAARAAGGGGGGGGGRAGGLAGAASAGATVVERIVATVGERAVLLSDLRRRAEPFMLQVQQTVPAGAQRSAAISQVYKAVLQKIVDEELMEKAASQAKVSITPTEIDEALKRVADQNKLTVDQVMSEAARAGMPESKYREELRRQLLEAKLLNGRMQNRI